MLRLIDSKMNYFRASKSATAPAQSGRGGAAKVAAVNPMKQRIIQFLEDQEKLRGKLLSDKRKGKPSQPVGEGGHDIVEVHLKNPLANPVALGAAGSPRGPADDKHQMSDEDAESAKTSTSSCTSSRKDASRAATAPKNVVQGLQMFDPSNPIECLRSGVYNGAMIRGGLELLFQVFLPLIVFVGMPFQLYYRDEIHNNYSPAGVVATTSGGGGQASADVVVGGTSCTSGAPSGSMMMLTSCAPSSSSSTVVLEQVDEGAPAGAAPAPGAPVFAWSLFGSISASSSSWLRSPELQQQSSATSWSDLLLFPPTSSSSDEQGAEENNKKALVAPLVKDSKLLVRIDPNNMFANSLDLLELNYMQISYDEIDLALGGMYPIVLLLLFAYLLEKLLSGKRIYSIWPDENERVSKSVALLLKHPGLYFCGMPVDEELKRKNLPPKMLEPVLNNTTNGNDCEDASSSKMNTKNNKMNAVNIKNDLKDDPLPQQAPEEVEEIQKPVVRFSSRGPCGSGGADLFADEELEISLMQQQQQLREKDHKAPQAQQQSREKENQIYSPTSRSCSTREHQSQRPAQLQHRVSSMSEFVTKCWPSYPDYDKEMTPWWVRVYQYLPGCFTGDITTLIPFFIHEVPEEEKDFDLQVWIKVDAFTEGEEEMGIVGKSSGEQEEGRRGSSSSLEVEEALAIDFKFPKGVELSTTSSSTSDESVCSSTRVHDHDAESSASASAELRQRRGQHPPPVNEQKEQKHDFSRSSSSSTGGASSCKKSTRSTSTTSTTTCDRKDIGLLIVLHGLNAGTKAEYIVDHVNYWVEQHQHLDTADGEERKPMAVAGINARGLGASCLTSGSFFHGARTDDMQIAIRELMKLWHYCGFDSDRIFVVSFSMGAIILGQLLSRMGLRGEDCFAEVVEAIEDVKNVVEQENDHHDVDDEQQLEGPEVEAPDDASGEDSLVVQQDHAQQEDDHEDESVTVASEQIDTSCSLKAESSSPLMRTKSHEKHGSDATLLTTTTTASASMSSSASSSSTSSSSLMTLGEVPGRDFNIHESASGAFTTTSTGEAPSTSTSSRRTSTADSTTTLSFLPNASSTTTKTATSVGHGPPSSANSNIIMSTNIPTSTTTTTSTLLSSSTKQRGLLEQEAPAARPKMKKLKPRGCMVISGQPFPAIHLTSKRPNRIWEPPLAMEVKSTQNRWFPRSQKRNEQLSSPTSRKRWLLQNGEKREETATCGVFGVDDAKMNRSTTSSTGAAAAVAGGGSPASCIAGSSNVVVIKDDPSIGIGALISSSTSDATCSTTSSSSTSCGASSSDVDVSAKEQDDDTDIQEAGDGTPLAGLRRKIVSTWFSTTSRSRLEAFMTGSGTTSTTNRNNENHDGSRARAAGGQRHGAGGHSGHSTSSSTTSTSVLAKKGRTTTRKENEVTKIHWKSIPDHMHPCVNYWRSYFTTAPTKTDVRALEAKRQGEWFYKPRYAPYLVRRCEEQEEIFTNKGDEYKKNTKTEDHEDNITKKISIHTTSNAPRSRRTKTILQNTNPHSSFYTSCCYEKQRLFRPIDPTKVLASRTLQEYDYHFSAPAGGFGPGFQGLLHYHAAQNTDVRTISMCPTLFLHALDDPICIAEGLLELVETCVKWSLLNEHAPEKRVDVRNILTSFRRAPVEDVEEGLGERRPAEGEVEDEVDHVDASFGGGTSGSNSASANNNSRNYVIPAKNSSCNGTTTTTSKKIKEHRALLLLTRTGGHVAWPETNPWNGRRWGYLKDISRSFFAACERAEFVDDVNV
ncbi:unnamed protein product [Amoebophrya sp. A25]|nr:unnamed protein product [Amoebophrya sp. A25]|eukprot:GSA25T00001465001.1